MQACNTRSLPFPLCFFRADVSTGSSRARPGCVSLRGWCCTSRPGSSPAAGGGGGQGEEGSGTWAQPVRRGRGCGAGREALRCRVWGRDSCAAGGLRDPKDSATVPTRDSRLTPSAGFPFPRQQGCPERCHALRDATKDALPQSCWRAAPLCSSASPAQIHCCFSAVSLLRPRGGGGVINRYSYNCLSVKAD